jgi:adenylate cyclase
LNADEQATSVPSADTHAKPVQAVRFPVWVLMSLLAAGVVNALASISTFFTIGLMGNVTAFALEVRAHEAEIMPYFNTFAYALPSVGLLYYVWPLLSYHRCGGVGPPSDIVQRRAVSFPAVAAIVCLAMWALGVVVFPTFTVIHLGRWSTELMSQQVLSPLVNGFIAATTTYLFVDWIFRASVYPELFPDGGLNSVRGTLTLGVRARMLVFLAAVAYLPLFTMLGLARSAQSRYHAGMEPERVVEALATGSTAVFFVYAGLGIVLTLALARTFTLPLADVLGIVRRVGRGDLSGAVRVGSADEVGRLQEGVNAMIAGLRDKERVMRVFGQAVDPEVRDRLLDGDAAGAERVTATVMFCDLRGFTSLAEQNEPEEVVRTLNAYFSEVASWTRECGGMVDKFIGDAALLVFGLFDRAEDDGDAGAAAALRCALGLRERLALLNVEREDGDRVPLAIRMAVHTGEVLAATIGSPDRHEYTVIGDSVNVAARLNELCKERSVDLIVSSATYARSGANGLGQGGDNEVSVMLRGRREPVSFVEIA